MSNKATCAVSLKGIYSRLLCYSFQFLRPTAIMTEKLLINKRYILKKIHFLITEIAELGCMGHQVSHAVSHAQMFYVCMCVCVV